MFSLEELVAPEPFNPDEYEQQHRTQWQAVIESNLRNIIATEGRFWLPDRVREVYGTVLGMASERHVRAAVKTLHDTGEIANTGIGRYFFREPIRPVS